MSVRDQESSLKKVHFSVNYYDVRFVVTQYYPDFNWKCMSGNTCLGTVGVWWGQGAYGDGQWACNQWVSGCNNNCNVQLIQSG